MHELEDDAALTVSESCDTLHCGVAKKSLSDDGFPLAAVRHVGWALKGGNERASRRLHMPLTDRLPTSMRDA